MTWKCRENINLVSFICLSFLVVSFSKQLLTLYFDAEKLFPIGNNNITVVWLRSLRPQ